MGMAAVLVATVVLASCAGSRGNRQGGEGSPPSRSAAPSPATSPSGPGEGIVFGRVQVRQGNCMPGPVPSGDARPNPCRTVPVGTTVYAHHPVIVNGSSAEPGFPGLGTPLEVSRSATDGRYEISLPPGRYSILVDDGGRPYCNSFEMQGGQSVVCPVEVKAGERTQRDVTINHALD